MQIVHTEVEENHFLLVASAVSEQRVDTEVHVAVDGRVVMSDEEPSRGGKQLRERGRIRRDGRRGERLQPVLDHLVARVLQDILE